MFLNMKSNPNNESEGARRTIFWGEAENINGQLFWCQDNLTVAVPLPVNGTISQSFFLISEAKPKPNLKAVPLASDTTVNVMLCLHSPKIKAQCDAGTRTKQLSGLENILQKYN
jgi:hypothetical protein